MSLFQSKKKNNKDKNKQEALTTFLQSGTSFRGDVRSEGPMRIDADFQGNIECRDRVVIGDGAFVKGTVNAAEIEIYGRYEGDLYAGSISLKVGCRVQGDISCEVLLSESGSFFNGNCKTLEGKSKKEIPVLPAEKNANLPVAYATGIKS